MFKLRMIICLSLLICFLASAPIQVKGQAAPPSVFVTRVFDPGLEAYAFFILDLCGREGIGSPFVPLCDDGDYDADLFLADVEGECAGSITNPNSNITAGGRLDLEVRAEILAPLPNANTPNVCASAVAGLLGQVVGPVVNQPERPQVTFDVDMDGGTEFQAQVVGPTALPPQQDDGIYTMTGTIRITVQSFIPDEVLGVGQVAYARLGDSFVRVDWDGNQFTFTKRLTTQSECKTENGFNDSVDDTPGATGQSFDQVFHFSQRVEKDELLDFVAHATTEETGFPLTIAEPNVQYSSYLMSSVNGDLTDIFNIEVNIDATFVDELTLGDANGDNAVNLLDVAPFIEGLTSGEYNCALDMNQDCEVNLLDVDIFVSIL